jgi:hypothetical protein
MHYEDEDATLYNNWLTDDYVTWILQFVTAIQSNRFCKCPSIVEMATHESEVSMPGDTNVVGIYGPGTGDKNG